MSIIHKATISPSKEEAVASWVPKQSWWNADASKLKIVTGYRFDDPAGEVGLQGLIVTGGDSTLYHVPVTYRGAPLEDAEAFLICTMQHSALGTRWVYDAIGDPVFQQQLARVIALGESEAEEFVVTEDGEQVKREPQSHISGSGNPSTEAPTMHAARVATEDGVSTATSGQKVLSVLRRLDEHAVFNAEVETLTCQWDGLEEPIVVATLT